MAGGRDEVRRRCSDSPQLRHKTWCQRKPGRLRKTHDTHTKEVQVDIDEGHTTTKYTSTSLFLSSALFFYLFVFLRLLLRFFLVRSCPTTLKRREKQGRTAFMPYTCPLETWGRKASGSQRGAATTKGRQGGEVVRARPTGVVSAFSTVSSPSPSCDTHRHTHITHADTCGDAVETGERKGKGER